MLLGRKAEPFDDPDCLYELKFDGFRALAVVRDGDCQLISRNGNAFKSFAGLRVGLSSDLRVRSAVLDGEIACLDSSGRSVFDDLFFRRREPVFIAFDILSVGGDDLRFLPLYERKRELRRVMKSRPLRSLYCSHVERTGVALFNAACQHDLEGIVAKWKYGPYVAGREETTWWKIRNRQYSQWEGRSEMFERPHEPRPADFIGWDACCAAMADHMSRGRSISF